MAISKKKRVRRRDTPPAPPPSMISSYLIEKEALIKKYAKLVTEGTEEEAILKSVQCWFEQEFKDVVFSAHSLILFDCSSSFDEVCVDPLHANTILVRSEDGMFRVDINLLSLQLSLITQFCNEQDFTNAVISEIDREWLAFHSLATINLQEWIEAKHHLSMSFIASVIKHLNIVQEKYNAEKREPRDD